MVGTNTCKIMAVIKKMFIFYLYELVANMSGGTLGTCKVQTRLYATTET